MMFHNKCPKVERNQFLSSAKKRAVETDETIFVITFLCPGSSVTVVVRM